MRQKQIFRFSSNFYSELEKAYSDGRRIKSPITGKYLIPSKTNISKSIENYIKSVPKNFESNLFDVFRERSDKPGYSSDNLIRIFSKKNTLWNPSRDFVDLLCCYVFGLKYPDCVNAGLVENNLDSYFSLKSNRISIENSGNGDKSNTRINTRRLINNEGIQGDFEIVDENYFEKYLTNSDKKHIDALQEEYFLKFNSSLRNVKEIVARGLNINYSDSITIAIDHKKHQSSINQSLSRASFGEPVLIKLLGFGGVGKTTLLWQLIRDLHKNYPVYYLYNTDPINLVNIFTYRFEQGNLPIILFIDNIAVPDTAKYLINFGNKIAELSAKNKVVLLCSDRNYRYEHLTGRHEFESNFFVKNRLSIEYTIDDLKDKFFEKLYSYLKPNETSEIDKQGCFSIFKDAKFKSLVDCALHLIVTETKNKKELKGLKYKFDWDDWKEVCKMQFPELSALYTIVSFFYRYGITVPEEYLYVYYQKPEVIESFYELISKQDYSPILSIEHRGIRTLRLRNEKLADWFFFVKGEEYGLTFFRQFLDRMSYKSDFHLFVSLIKSKEFLEHPEYQKILPHVKIVSILDKYLLGRYEYNEEDINILELKYKILTEVGSIQEAGNTISSIVMHHFNFKNWKKISELLWNRATHDFLSDFCLRKVALEMPTTSSKFQDKIKLTNIKINLCQKLLQNPNIEFDRNEIELTIVGLFFKIGRIKRSKIYYIDNVTNGNVENYVTLTNDLLIEALDSLYKSLDIARSLSDNGSESKAIFSIGKILENIFSLDDFVDFTNIQFNYQNDDKAIDKIKDILHRSISILCAIVKHKKVFAATSYDLLESTFGKNILFDKVLLYIILYKNNLIELFGEILEKYLCATQNIYENEPDILRLLGLLHLVKFEFAQSRLFLERSLMNCRDTLQQARVDFYIAMLIVSIIHKNESEYYGSVEETKKMILEAEHIKQRSMRFRDTQEIYTFPQLTTLNKTIDDLKNKFMKL